MILTVAAFLTTVGFVAFVAGNLFEMQEVAVIGGVIMLGVGVMVTSEGLEYRDGMVEENVSANTTATQYSYTEVPTPTRLPLGTLWMILAGSLVLRSINRVGEQA